MNTEDGTCLICGREAEVGCTGVSQGKVYHEDYCESCYHNRHDPQFKPKLPDKYKEFQERGIRVSELNHGIQLVLKKGAMTVDFWPTTGRWVSRDGRWNIKGRGKEQMLAHIEGAKEAFSENRV